MTMYFTLLSCDERSDGSEQAKNGINFLAASHLLLAPGPLMQARLEDLVPPVQALHVITEGPEHLRDALPVLRPVALYNLLEPGVLRSEGVRVRI